MMWKVEGVLRGVRGLWEEREERMGRVGKGR